MWHDQDFDLPSIYPYLLLSSTHPLPPSLSLSLLLSPSLCFVAHIWRQPSDPASRCARNIDRISLSANGDLRRCRRDRVTRARYYEHKRHPPRREGIPESARDNIASDVRSIVMSVDVFLTRHRSRETFSVSFWRELLLFRNYCVTFELNLCAKLMKILFGHAFPNASFNILLKCFYKSNFTFASKWSCALFDYI